MLDGLAEDWIETQDDAVRLSERKDIVWGIAKSSAVPRRKCVSVRLGILRQASFLACVPEFGTEVIIERDGDRDVGEAVNLEITVSGTKNALVYRIWKKADPRVLKLHAATSALWDFQVDSENQHAQAIDMAWNEDYWDAQRGLSWQAAEMVYGNLLRPYEERMLALDFSRIIAGLRPVLEELLAKETASASITPRFKEYKPRDFKSEDSAFRSLANEIAVYLESPLAKSITDSGDEFDVLHARGAQLFRRIGSKIQNEHELLKQHAGSLPLEDQPRWWKDRITDRVTDSPEKYL